MTQADSQLNASRNAGDTDGADAFAPLSDFYARAGVQLPPVEHLTGDAIPQPHRDLLVHDGDMTPTLEKHHNQTLHLRVLDTRHDNPGSKDPPDGEAPETLSREVVLLTDDRNTPVEFGAIQIYLQPFPAFAQQQILACRRPLGAILGDCEELGHTSRPSVFFRFMTDSIVREALRLDQSQWLYGRCNVLRHRDGRPLARVVEILPPQQRA